MSGSWDRHCRAGCYSAAMAFLPPVPFRHLWLAGAICFSGVAFAMPGTAAAQQVLSSSQFIPNGGDCNGNGRADRNEVASANRDDDGDGVCNGADACPLAGLSCPMQAITVPADASDRMLPHVTYSGAMTTLKGIARYGGNQFMWNFGDGTAPTPWTAIADAYNLGVNHVYTGAVGQEFTATLMVRNSATVDVVSSATYPVVIKDGGASLASVTREQTDVRAQMAREMALWYLHTTLTRGAYADGAPGYAQPWARPSGGLTDVCAVTAAFASHGHVAARPWQVTIDEDGNRQGAVPYNYDPYVENARRLLNYLSANAVVRPITAQTAGNPDVNANGIGVSIGPDEFRQNGLCAMAFAESAGTDWFAGTGPANVYGRPHTAVSQDLVDWLAYGQADGVGGNRGGWTYQANGGATNDVLRWVVLALGSQEGKMGATVPAFVRSEMPVWLNFSRYSALDPRHGSSGYAAPNDFNTVAWTASAMLGRLFAFNPPNPAEMQSAVGFIARSWLENDNGWHTNLGDSHAMSAVAKAFRTVQPPVKVIADFDYTLGQPESSTAFHWYYGPAHARHTGYAGNLLARQNANGSFSDVLGFTLDGNGFSSPGRNALAAMVLGPVGAAATATASATSLAFGLVDIGAASPAQVVTLTNDGEYAFAFDSITATGPFVVTSGCGSLMPPAGEGAPTCTVSVTFGPTATGVVSGVLTVAGTNGLPATTIALSGTGIEPRLTPAISWPPSTITYGTALSATQLRATTDVAGTFDYSPSLGTVLDAGTGQLLTVTFTPDDTNRYLSVTTTSFVDVAPATPVVTLTAATAEYDGQPHSASARAFGVNGESLGPITITYDGQSGPPVFAGTYAVVAGVAANGNYTAASASASLVITKVTPVLTWPAQPSITYGTVLDSVSLNASASVPGTFSYTPAEGTVLSGGAGQLLTAVFTPYDSANHAGGTVATTIDVLRATPHVAVTGGTYVYDGQPHAATALATGVNDAPLDSPNVTYNGVAGAPVAAGTYTVIAAVAASANYQAASATATITIERAAATVTAGSDTKVYGMPDPVMTPTGTGFLATDGIVVTHAARDAGDGVGFYVTRAAASGAAVSNYAVTAIDGALTVTPAALVVTANGATRSVNTPNPVFTGTMATVVAGDAITATYTTTATTASGVGAYAIVPVLLDPAGRLGNYAVTLVPGTLTVTAATNTAPVCSSVTASTRTLWPANHQWIRIGLTGAQDAEGGPLQFRIASIFQDEPTDSTGDGNTAIDGRGVGTSTASVRAERLGSGNGRVYRIGFDVTDQGGLSCSGTVTVGVPLSQRAAAVDDGPIFDSTVAAPASRPRKQ